MTSGRSRTEAQEYWAKTHGPLVANAVNLKRYHHYFSLPEAYESDLKPTFIGISMFWREDPYGIASLTPEGLITDPFMRFYRNQPGGSDDAQLFDRTKRWPVDDQHADILADENIIIDGQKTPDMVNAIIMVCKLPGLDHKDFFQHWSEVQVPLAKKLPGLRRYIQNPAHLEGFAMGKGSHTHDGFSEFWFDDFAAFQNAYRSPEWQAMEEDGKSLFQERKGVVIGREYIQKDENWKPRDYGALALSEAEVRERLEREGYKSLLASTPDSPARIKSAAEKGKLAVWTAHHLAIWEEPYIDVRPDR